MMNDFISLFLGAMNDLLAENPYLQEYQCILVIVISALSVLMITCVTCELIKAIANSFLRGFED